VLALVVGFASQRTLANFVAGILIAITQPVRLGDRVSYAGVDGVVEEIGVTYTFIRAADGSRLVVPNDKLASDTIVNSSIRNRETFAEITGVEPSAFGFPVVVHPREPDTAWFVPEIKDEKRIPREGKLVVTRTRDGGKTFDVLTKGLPQSHAYDVVYRHALALDEGGERLAFGSTTGGLWVSEDQGDSWACVTHTLPPVYAVRFA